MKESIHPKVKAHHLTRAVLVYVRQSSLPQVRNNPGSRLHQEGLTEHAIRLGWPESAITVIEDDLGLSGTSGDHREGWKRLLQMVAAREVGIILVSDPTRLSRSAQDAEVLLGLCRLTDALLAIEGTVYDLNSPSDRLVLRIRFDVGVFDNEDRVYRFRQAKRALAEKGIAVTHPPTGYVVVEKGRWAKHPDRAVQQCIEEVFRQYLARGTVGGVLRFFVKHGLQFPKWPIKGQIEWVRPHRSRIYVILTNPAYAGYYVYNRRPAAPGNYPDKTVRRRTSWEEWITVPNHHEPYVDAADWRAIHERLQGNRVSIRQPAGTGPALAQGLLRCGRCGRRMHVQYYPLSSGGKGFTYGCGQAYSYYGEPRCLSVHGRILDTLLAAAILRCLEPPEMEAVLAAAGEANWGYEAARREREAKLARARHDGRLTEERYKEVDPRNRLVAATLEQQWEEAQRSLRQLEREYVLEPLSPPLEVTLEVMEAIRRLAEDVPALWAAPSTTNQDRKELVRLFIEEVRIVAIEETGFEVEIAWVGGAVTRHTVLHPWASGIIARRLAAEGRTRGEIAAALNKLGLRTVERGEPYTADAVRSLLNCPARRFRLAGRSPKGAGGDEWPGLRTGPVGSASGGA